MSTKETYLRDLVAQLLKVNYEITVLEFRVEEAMPEVRKVCYQHVRALRDGYNGVEKEMERIIEEGEETQNEGYDEIDRALQDLLRLLDHEGSAIRGRLSEQIYFLDALEHSRSEDVKTKKRRKRSNLQIMVRRKRGKRSKPVEKLVEGELWSRKKII